MILQNSAYGFELWTAKGRGLVLATSSEDPMCRVTVKIFRSVGVSAERHATTIFNRLCFAMKTSLL